MSGAQSAFDSIAGDHAEHGPAPTDSRAAAAAVIKGYGQGNLALATIGGLLGAAAGGVAWVALATVTGWQLSLFAIVLAGLVGFGVGQGNGGRGGFGAGIIAVLFSILGVVGTQAALTHMAVEEALAESAHISESDAREDLAWTVFDEFEGAGQTMTEIDGEWPPEVLAEVDNRWQAMSQAERDEYRASMRNDMRGVLAESPLITYGVAYLWTNGWFGFVCLGLAVTTAWTTASRDVADVAKQRGMIPSGTVASAAVVQAGPAIGPMRGMPPAPVTNAAPMKSMLSRTSDPVTEEIVPEPADGAPAPVTSSAPMMPTLSRKRDPMTEAIAPDPAAAAPESIAPEEPMGLFGQRFAADADSDDDDAQREAA